MTTPVAVVDRVAFSYESGLVLDHVSLTVDSADFLLLLGSNGSGKSTLMKVMLGLLEPQAGSVSLFGKPPRSRDARACLGYVPQRAAISSRVPATVAEVVMCGSTAGSPFGVFTKRNRRAAGEALDRVGLAESAKRRIGELSGGQQQRVLVARALVSNPRLLVLDEPTAGVDKASQLRFADVLRTLHKDGVAIVMVAHDLGAVASDLTRIVALHQGHLDEISDESAKQQTGLFVEDHPGPVSP
ncbi:MAG: metal ABC transporter ATP-binding protein [Actinomycetota bacterium]